MSGVRAQDLCGYGPRSQPLAYTGPAQLPQHPAQQGHALVALRCQPRLYQGYTWSCIYTNNGYLRTSRLKSKTRGLGKSLCGSQSRGQVRPCLGTRQEPPGVAERAQSLILLCKVETRSSIDNLLNINVALMSTLHNDMLVIIQIMRSYT